MGFGEKLNQFILSCLGSVEYIMLLNGIVFGSFCPKKELSQGDPLSSNIPIMCFEFFSRLISKEKAHRNLDGIKVCGKAPAISHLSLCQCCNDSMSC